jgi:predicted dehydrogenase
MRVAIIGCGKIADEHASAVRLTPGAKLVATCDREELMARQLAERCHVPKWYGDVQTMLRDAKPQVCHVTTPPQSHYPIGKLCVENGVSVLLEKPFTVAAPETEELIAIAAKTGAKLTAGHNNQFNHAATEMRELIKAGFLGGPVTHMESVFSYNLGDERYAKALLGDKKHWVRALPGKLLHNVISHGVSKIAEYLPSDSPQVMACGFPSEILRRLKETEIINELRVIIRDGDTTGYFTFSSTIGPGSHYFRISGPKNTLLVDHDHQVVIKVRNSGYKSYLKQFFPPLQFGRQYFTAGVRNMRKFLGSDFHNDAGRRRLLRQFYDAIDNKGPVPIPYRELLCTGRIMDDIFKQIYAPPGAI